MELILMDTRFYYIYRKTRELRYDYLCVCEHGARHFHVSDYTKMNRDSGRGPNAYFDYTGGVEIHSATQLRFRNDKEVVEANHQLEDGTWEETPYWGDKPSQDPCCFLGKPCWADGSSLWASEVWIPFWLHNGKDACREEIFAWLRYECLQQWYGED